MNSRPLSVLLAVVAVCMDVAIAIWRMKSVVGKGTGEEGKRRVDRCLRLPSARTRTRPYLPGRILARHRYIHRTEARTEYNAVVAVVAVVVITSLR